MVHDSFPVRRKNSREICRGTAAKPRLHWGHRFYGCQPERNRAALKTIQYPEPGLSKQIYHGAFQLYFIGLVEQGSIPCHGPFYFQLVCALFFSKGEKKQKPVASAICRKERIGIPRYAVC